ncbi:hypothetical protein GCM10026982_43800 [Nocardiopsis aegyptia]
MVSAAAGMAAAMLSAPKAAKVAPPCAMRRAENRGLIFKVILIRINPARAGQAGLAALRLLGTRGDPRGPEQLTQGLVGG